MTKQSYDDLWQALIADCNKEPCDYPCLRDDLGDWLLDMAGRYPALSDYAKSYVDGTADEQEAVRAPTAPTPSGLGQLAPKPSKGGMRCLTCGTILRVLPEPKAGHADEPEPKA